MTSEIAYASEFILKNFNPDLHELTLTSDGPLFGFDKEEKIVVSSTLRAQNGNLVVLSLNGTNDVFRFEIIDGVEKLWPGNRVITEVERNNLFVIVEEGKESKSKFDVSNYFI